MDGNISSLSLQRNGSHNDSITDLLQPSVGDWIMISLYIPLIAVAFIANMLIIIIVCKDYHMRSVTNYFLVNLSVADLLVTLICMPNTIIYLLMPLNKYGEYLCKISAYLQCISASSSIFTITAMAIDRYLAIAKPFGLICRCFNKRTTIAVITCLWFTSLILFLPILFVQTAVDTGLSLDGDNSGNLTYCSENWNNFVIPQNVIGIVWFVFLFIVPGVINLFAYSMMGRTLCSVTPPCDMNEGLANRQQHNRLVRDRKRVACILLLLAFVFAGCWLPYQTLQLLKDIRLGDYSDAKKYSYLIILGHLNSALNPIIFCALSRKFRGSIRGLFKVQIRLRRRQAINRWVDSGSGSGTQLHYSLHRIKSIPTVQNQLSLLNYSNQKINSNPNNHNLKSCNV